MTTPLVNHTTIEEMEDHQQPAAPSLAEIKLDGGEIPEDLKGKSVADLVQMQKQLTESLRLSEQGRQQLLQQQQLEKLTAPPPPEPPKEEPELTEDQLAELYQQDPIKAMRYINASSIKKAEQNVYARLGPLVQSTAQTLEIQAREKHKEDFELLGSEISTFLAGFPNKDFLNSPGAWDEVINVVRGRNIEKIVAHRVAQAGTLARQGQIQTMGAVIPPTNSNITPRSTVVVDDYTKEIAKNLGMTIEEYTKWSAI